MISEYNNCEATYLNQLVSNGLHKQIRRFKELNSRQQLKANLLTGGLLHTSLFL